MEQSFVSTAVIFQNKLNDTVSLNRKNNQTKASDNVSKISIYSDFLRKSSMATDVKSVTTCSNLSGPHSAKISINLKNSFARKMSSSLWSVRILEKMSIDSKIGKRPESFSKDLRRKCRVERSDLIVGFWMIPKSRSCHFGCQE